MSLINEALKKAQHLQTRPTVSTPVTAPASQQAAPEFHQSVPKRDKPMSVRKLFIISSVVAVLFIGSLVTVGVTVFWLASKPSVSAKPEAVAQTAPPAQTTKSVEANAVQAAKKMLSSGAIPIPKSISPNSIAGKALEATNDEASTLNQLESTAKTEDSVSAQPEPTPHSQSKPVESVRTQQPKPANPAPAVAAATVAHAAPVQPAPAHVNQPEPKVLAWVNKVRVTGIRITNSGNMVLMNGKVYKTGDTVNYELGVKITRITANGLIFSDPQGNTYTAQF